MTASPAASTPTDTTDQPIGPALPGWAPRAMPDPRVLTGRTVRVEALTLDHAPGLFAATCGRGRDARWTYVTVGPFEAEAGLAGWLRALLEEPTTVPMAIIDPATGDPVGTASYLRVQPAIGVLEVGAVVYGDRLARTTAATEAMYLLARHAFEDLGYRRYEWKCDALNAASRAAALRLGFRFEGIFRNATIYKGRSRDTAWFAMTDADWAVLRPVYDAWLAAAHGRESGPAARPVTAGPPPRLSAATAEALRPALKQSSDHLT